MSDTKNTLDSEAIVQRYIRVWTIEDDRERRAAVAEIWASDGVEFVHEQRFEGHSELTDRIARAYDAFFAKGEYVGGYGEDLTVHQDILRFTMNLAVPGVDGEPGEIAWVARVFLLLDDDGKVQQDYHITLQALPA